MLIEVHMGPIHFVFSAKSGCTIKKKRKWGGRVAYCAQLYKPLKICPKSNMEWDQI